MKKKNSKQILKKTIVVSTSAVMATTTVMGTIPLNVLANDKGIVNLLENESKIENSEIKNVKVRSIADFDSNTKLEHVTDGNIDTYLDSNYINYDENLQYIQFELKEATDVSHIRIHPRTSSTNGRPNHYKIYAGTNENSLNLLTEGDMDTTAADWVDIKLNQPVNASFVKVELTADEAEFAANHVISVSEIELYKTEAEEVKDVYAVSGYQGEDGKVYLELNGKPGEIAHPHWLYKEIDGKHYAVSDAPVEKLTYDSVCIYGAGEEQHYWNYVYVDENGKVSVSTTYNLQKPVATIKTGSKEVTIDDSNTTINEKFTDVPVVHVEGVNLNNVTVQAVGVGQEAKNVEVTGNHGSVDIPLVYTSTNKPKSATYSIWVDYGESNHYLKDIKVTVDENGVNARASLKDKVKETEGFAENDYTADSWKTLQSALENANEVLNNNIESKTNIEQAASSLQAAIDNLVENPKIDKSELKDKIDTYKDFMSDNDSFKIFSKTLEKAQEIYNDPNATQDSVDYYARNLEAHYYLVKVAELNTKYSYNQQNIDYSQYTTESIIPVIRMYGITRDRTNVNYFENEETEGQMKEWYEEYQSAVKGLSEITEKDKYIGFNKDSDSSSKRQGNFSVVSEEVIDTDDGKQTRVTVQFDNDGLHPIYGKSKPNANGETEYGRFNISNSNYDQARVSYYDSDFKHIGTKYLSDYEYLDGESSYYDGFIASTTFDSRAAYITFEFYDGVSYETYSPWFYRLDKIEDSSNIHVSDKDSLEEALDKIEENGTIYLDSDINWDKTEVVMDKDITIDAQGHKIIRPSDQYQATKSMLSINSKVSLKNISLQAEGISESVLEVNKNGQAVLGEGVTLSGKVKKGNAVVMVNGGTLEIDGATITDSDGLGIILNNQANLEMNSGMISGLNVSGVSVRGGSTFTMNGGKILNNKQAGITHDAGDNSKVYVKGGEISGNRAAIDVNGTACGNSNLELSKGVLKDEYNISLRTSTLVLPENYENIKLGRADEDKISSYIEYIKKTINPNLKFSSTTNLVSYWLTPSTNNIEASLKQNSTFKNAVAFFVPVTVNGNLDETTQIIQQNNVENKNDYLAIHTEELKPNQAYVLLIADYVADKSNLQKLVNDVKDYSANTDMYNEDFKPALEAAQNILTDESATQEETDAAYEALDKAYARCTIHDLYLNYAGFDSYEVYEDYTTQSSLSLISAMNKAEDMAQANNLSAKEYKEILNDVNEKIKALVKADEGQVDITKGVTKEAYRNKNNTGYFEVTGEPNGDTVILHVKYHNDGINHITEEENGKLDLSNLNKYMMAIKSEYYDREKDTVYSRIDYIDKEDLKPLDGEKDLAEGFQFDYETDPGEMNFFIKESGSATHWTDSYGTYLTDVDKKAPEVVSINKMEDGRIHVEFSEPVTIEDTNWEKSDVDGETDGRFWIGTLTEDKIYEVKVKDFPGNETTFTVDHKSPIASSISYSTTKPTNGKVKVTVNFDEAVSVVDTEQNPGWKYNREHTSASKEYTDNAEEDVIFEDETGNEVVVSVHIANIDKTAPAVTVKDSSIGEKNHYGKLDLKLYDASGIDYVVVNGEKRELTNNVWSDLNDDGVNYKEGENTVEVYDVAGNKTVYTFDYDKTGPEVTVKDSSIGEKNHYGKLDLKLYDASGIDYVVINGEKRELTNNTWSDLNDDGANYKEGENTVEVYDVCGNKTEYTFDYDKTGPEVTVKDSSKGSDGSYSKLDLKLYDASGIDYAVVNGEKRELTNSAWSDLNDDGVNYKEGENTVEVYDVCGNKTVYTFLYDTTAPIINAEDKTITKGTDFEPMRGVSATDQGKDITEAIVVEKNEVNTNKTGTYEVSYSVQDKAGNTSVKTIHVTVERESLWDHIVDEVKDITHKVIKAVDDFFDWLF